jgi:homopolymeric O-antigen transport system permease protein
VTESVNILTELRGSTDLLRNLTLREIRGKYKRTLLGQLWSLLNPIAMMATYSIVFAIILRGRPDRGYHGLDVFALWLTCALLPWLFFQNVLISGMGSLLSNANLIQKVYFPRFTLVVSTALAWLFTFTIEIAVLVVALLIFGGNPLPYLPVTALFMIVLLLFGLGLSFLFAIANVYFRDTQHLISIAMQVWFYATPIIYPIGLVGDKHPGLAKVMRINPLERFGEVFRQTLYYAKLPSLSDSLVVLAWSLGALVVGYFVFSRFQDRLAEEL